MARARVSPKVAPAIAIVGAGRVGRALGKLLHQRGWRIGAVVARSSVSARAAMRAIGAGKPYGRSPHGRLPFVRLPVEKILAADLVLLSTPDSAIASVARELAALGGGKTAPNNWRGKVVLHTCGALDRGVLLPLNRRGAATGSWHPLQTFSRRGLPSLQGAACAIEGSPAALRWARRLCRELGCVAFRVPCGRKPAYHAAAAFAAGHVLGLIQAATRILMTVGFSRRQAASALLPLTRQTLANFERFGGSRSWTGPASRGDLATVAQHLAALRRFPPEYHAAYSAVTRLSALLLTPNPRAALRHLDSVIRA